MDDYDIEDIGVDHPSLLTAHLEACVVARCRESGGTPWKCLCGYVWRSSGSHQLSPLMFEAAKMRDRDTNRQIEGLKTIKSAFLLEARALADAGLAAAAWPFYRRAAELECELADLFQTQGNPRDAGVSLFSAASCFLLARQYRTAWELFQRVVDRFPEAEGLMAQCQDKEDAPGLAETPALEALIRLLVRKGIISDDDWVQAVQAR